MKISVAMAVYNGEKYIKQQIETILNQSFSVDEIIVSDDGSNDSTLDVVRAFNDPRIKILTDNTNHGYCGNFEHALNNTSGDIIFLADQDDIWMPNKVEMCVSIFEKYENIELIISNGCLVNANSNQIAGDFNPALEPSDSGHLSKKKFFLKTIYSCLAVGMSMCFTRSLLRCILPFPKAKIVRISRLGHDTWIAFCAMHNGSVYYTNEQLVKYRIHQTNTSIWQKNLPFRKKFERLLSSSYSAPFDMYALTSAMLQKLDTNNEEDTDAIKCVNALYYPSLRQIEAFSKNRISGTSQLIKLYFKDEIYKKNGAKYIIGQLYLSCFGRRYLKKFAKEYNT